jgi:large subunit ribosomal protein L16
LILKPRNVKYKKFHKKRRLLFFQKLTRLKLGTSGLLLLQPLRLKSTAIYRLTLFLKKAVRKFDKTHRVFWFSAFPHLPLTRKPIGARMGKGKGKAKKWFALIKGGVNLIEFLNLRTGRALYFFKQISLRLSAKTVPIFHHKTFISHPFNSSKRMFFRVYW